MSIISAIVLVKCNWTTRHPCACKDVHKENLFRSSLGTSLMDQCLRLHASNAGSLSLVPGQGTRSHMPIN